jgi:NhaD family Na+/H+ antiporter
MTWTAAGYLALAALAAILVPELALAQAAAQHATAAPEAAGPLDLQTSWVGFASLAVFIGAYVFVMAEEVTHMRKSKPVILAAGLIWIFVGIAYAAAGRPEIAVEHIRENLLDYAELMLFLLAAMTYVNTMEERRVFDALRAWLVKQGFTYRQLFWLTGALSFCLSPFIDNLTTALVMGAVVVSVGSANSRFVVLACINVVVAANAGGAFSPFGDITTLMVWQRGHAGFFDFFAIFLPSLVNWLVPAGIMHFTVPKSKGEGSPEPVEMKHGAWLVIGLFLVTVATAVSFHTFLHLPPVFGMMLGLGLLQVFGFYLRRRGNKHGSPDMGLDAYYQTARAEWDTLLFFYGVILSVGGLSIIGYLSSLSHVLYGGYGATSANVVIGVASSILDNIPLMFAVLSMEPHMPLGQWLLITLTAGVGGSLLSIGSAAGVALMGTARGYYTFFSHLKWSWAVALGFAASVGTHLLVNHALF